nr:PREDICTED: uncharacterized protein LOC109035536 [Bemisia tabaci]
MLCNSPTIFTDGTFKTTSNQFAQLFTVHAIFMNFVFPVVFCLTQQKDEETYREIYRQLRLLAEDFQLTLNPQISMSDFELANLNALRGSFDGISIRGCLFQFIGELQKEQQDTEAAVTQLLGGHGHLRDPINSTNVRNQRRVETIVGNYEEYNKQQNNVRTYLRAIALDQILPWTKN